MLFDRGDRGQLGPGGQVGDRAGGGVDAEDGQDGVGDGLDDELLARVVELGVAVLAVEAHEGVRELVHGGGGLAVGAGVGVDADGARLVLIPAVGAALAGPGGELEGQLELAREAIEGPSGLSSQASSSPATSRS